MDGAKFELDRAALTKHAIILGATGSGKTVLSKVIVEEAACRAFPPLPSTQKETSAPCVQSAIFDFSKWSGKEADAEE